MYTLYIDDRPTTDRPLISKISNGHISATDHPIHFKFGSRVAFSKTTDGMALFPVQKKSKMAAAAILEKIQMAISPQLVVRSTSCFALKLTPFIVLSVVSSVA